MENPFLVIERRLGVIEELLLSIKHTPPAPPIPEPAGDDLLSKKDAARLIGCSQSTIDNHARAKRLERYYIGKSVRFRRNEVLALAKTKAA